MNLKNTPLTPLKRRAERKENSQWLFLVRRSDSCGRDGAQMKDCAQKLLAAFTLNPINKKLRDCSITHPWPLSRGELAYVLKGN